MSRGAGVAVLIGLLALLTLPAPGGTAPPERAGGILVAFQERTPPASRLAVLQRLGLAVDPQVRAFSHARVRPAPGGAAAVMRAGDLLARLRADPAVRVAEPDYPVAIAHIPNDPLFPQQYALRNTGQSGGVPDADIDADEAWDITRGSETVVVAVTDTGVDHRHPDLTDNILRDGSGAVVGYDFSNNDGDPRDDNGHGTHVAGIIGARGDNGIGISGVSPRVRIMPIKFLAADGNGTTSGAIQAIDFAVNNGARIINASWGGTGFSQLMLEAILRARAAGILFVAAAGNEATDLDSSPSFPAAFTLWTDNVLSVASTNNSDRLSGFSNYGDVTVDLAAPGSQIRSTLPGSAYGNESGTSMATPMVSGAAALILAHYPGITLEQLRARLLFNVDRPAALAGLVRTGRLNAAAALVDDASPPGAPVGFRAVRRSARSLLISWTAAGDDGLAGAASRYEARYATSPLTEANFTAGEPIGHLPAPAVSGSVQGVLVTGLAPERDYYVALRAVDRVGNRSPLAVLGPVRTPAASPEVVLLNDDAELAPRFFGDPPWAITTEQSFSPTHSYADSPGAPYANSRDLSLTAQTSLPLLGLAPELSFAAMTDLEAGYDFLYVELSTDGGQSWERAALQLTGFRLWTVYRVSLAQYYAADVRIRFRLVTDGVATAGGVWLDDIRVAGEQLEPVDPGIPAAPSKLAITAAGQTSLALSWQDNSSDELGFLVERRTSGGVFQEVALVDPDVRRLVDTGLPDDTPFTYRVSAVGTGGNSDPTPAVTGRTLPFPPPAPENLRATGGDRRVDLEWDPAPRATVYHVGRSLFAGGPYQDVATNLPVPAFADGNVVNDVVYYYVVIAANAGGVSPPSSEVAAVPRTPPPPEPPTNLRVSQKQERLLLRWVQSASPDVVWNRVYRSQAKNGPYERIKTLAAKTKWDYRPRSSKRFYYRVTAVTADGRESVLSNQVAARLK